MTLLELSANGNSKTKHPLFRAWCARFHIVFSRYSASGEGVQKAGALKADKLLCTETLPDTHRLPLSCARCRPRGSRGWVGREDRAMAFRRADARRNARGRRGSFGCRPRLPRS